MDFSSCADAIRRELAAYRESGQCQRYVRQGIFRKVKDCMIWGATESGKAVCSGKTEVEVRNEVIRQLNKIDDNLYPDLP